MSMLARPNKQYQSLIYGASALPSSADYPGLDFVVSTVSPLNLNSYIYRNDILSYQAEDLSGLSFVERLFSFYRIQLCSFSSSTVSDNKITFNRIEICRAWLYALNGNRFHGEIYQHACTVKEQNPSLYKQNIVAIHKLFATARIWLGIFKEIDFALHLLREAEIKHRIPTAWKRMGRFELTRILCLPQRLTKDSKIVDLTDLFLYAAQHCYKLHKLGYNQEHYALARKLGYDLGNVPFCKIPRLDLDEDITDTESSGEYIWEASYTLTKKIE